MTRYRLSVWAVLIGLGLVSGCTNFGGNSSGGLFSNRFSTCSRRNRAMPCETCGSCGSCGSCGVGGCCGEGPSLEDPWMGAAGGAAPGAPVMGTPAIGSPPTMLPQTTIPPLQTAPPPRINPEQAQPLPAPGTVSRRK